MMLQLHEKTQLEGVKKEREKEREASQLAYGSSFRRTHRHILG
jgi:hypothetical protein